jgi:hypothetical protein
MPSSYEKGPRMARARNIFRLRSVNFHGDVAPVPKPLPALAFAVDVPVCREFLLRRKR